MAEYCLECWSKLNDTKYTEDDFVISKHLDLCEGCAQYKRVIIRPRDSRLAMMFTWPLELIAWIIVGMVRIICKIYRYCKDRNKNKSR